MLGTEICHLLSTSFLLFNPVISQRGVQFLRLVPQNHYTDKT